MGDRLAEIQRALDGFRMEDARELVEHELEENTSEAAYYLAAQAALSQGQRVEYLEKALELDPTHQGSLDELSNIKRPDKVAPEPAPALDSPPTHEPTHEPAGPRSFKLAPISKRFIAIVIDGFIVGIFSFALLFATGPFAALNQAMASADLDAINAAIAQFQSDALPVNLAVSAVYNVVLMRLFNGQTLGKMVFGLRVIKKNGRRVSVLDALLRNVLGYMVSQIFLLGYIWAFTDRENQAWHDKMAGTVVVVERLTVTQ
ncbi:MAG: RDD family protein [Anaerolineae bacterium]|nr:RDD family protein [Anaerolineae bacterium]